MGWLERTALTEEKKRKGREREGDWKNFFYRDDKWGVRALARSEKFFFSKWHGPQSRQGLVDPGGVGSELAASSNSLSRLQATADVNRDLV